MMRLAGLQVNECPKFLSIAPSIDDHSVYFPAADIRFPFQIEGMYPTYLLESHQTRNSVTMPVNTFC